MSIFSRKKRNLEPPPPSPAGIIKLDHDQRLRVSMALDALAGRMREAASDAGTAPMALASATTHHRDALMADAQDSERLASMFRVALDVDVLMRPAAMVVSNDDTRERELAALVDVWATIGVPPNAIAALLFRSGARIFANLGIGLDELVDRLRNGAVQRASGDAS